MKKSLNLIDCLECGTPLSSHAEACPECGYPHVPTSGIEMQSDSDRDSSQSALKEYRFLQAGGFVVLVVGVAAIIADSRFAAGVTLTVGGILYLTGLLGAWWNRRE